MSDAGLIVLGWALGLVASGGAGVIGWWRRRQQRERMRAVVNLFFTGTDLRNRGMQVRTPLEETNWHTEWRQWAEGTTRATVAVDPIRAANVGNLVNFPPLHFQGVTPKMQDSLSELTETLQRLSVFIAA